MMTHVSFSESLGDCSLINQVTFDRAVPNISVPDDHRDNALDVRDSAHIPSSFLCISPFPLGWFRAVYPGAMLRERTPLGCMSHNLI